MTNIPYSLSNIQDWNESTAEFFVCKAQEAGKSQFNTDCKNDHSKPSVHFAYLFILRLFGHGFVTAFYIAKDTENLWSKWKTLFGKLAKSISSWIEQRNR